MILKQIQSVLFSLRRQQVKYHQAKLTQGGSGHKMTYPTVVIKQSDRKQDLMSDELLVPVTREQYQFWTQGVQNSLISMLSLVVELWKHSLDLFTSAFSPCSFSLLSVVLECFGM